MKNVPSVNFVRVQIPQCLFMIVFQIFSAWGCHERYKSKQNVNIHRSGVDQKLRYNLIAIRFIFKR